MARPEGLRGKLLGEGGARRQGSGSCVPCYLLGLETGCWCDLWGPLAGWAQEAWVPGTWCNLVPSTRPHFPQAWAPTGLRDDIAGPRVLCSAVSSGRGDGGASSSVKGSLSKEAARTRRQEDKSGTNCPNYVRQPYFLLGTARRGPDRSVPVRTPHTHCRRAAGHPGREPAQRCPEQVSGPGPRCRADLEGGLQWPLSWGCRMGSGQEVRSVLLSHHSSRVFFF